MAQFTVGAILEHGIARRALHVEHVFALLSLLPGHLGSTLDVCLWEAVELFLRIDGHIRIVSLVQQVLAELGLECADAGVEFAQLGLLLFAEFGTALGKCFVGLSEHRHLLVVQDFLLGLRLLDAHLVMLVIDGLYAVEKLWVEVDAVVVGGQGWRIFGLQCLKFRGGVARREVFEDQYRLAEQLAALVEGSDGVAERWLFRVFTDVFYLALLLLHTQLDGFAEVFGRDAVIVDDAIFGGGFFQKRIAASAFLSIGRTGDCDCTD